MYRRNLILGASALSLGAAMAPVAHAQDLQERVIKVSHGAASDAPIGHGVRKFAELLAAKSGGRFKVREFPSAQLGNEAQQISALQGGTQEIYIPTGTSIATLVKEFGLTDFPFTIRNTEQADALYDGPAGVALLDKLQEKGLYGLGYWENGFRNVTNSRQPIAKLEDLAGLKIRVLPNPVFVEAFKALKANPTPLSFGELYGALESRAVDAQENPYSLILSQRFNEVQKYASSTNHVYSAYVFLVSKKYWDKLTDTDRKIFKDAFAEARTYQRNFNRQFTASAMKELAAKGMKINDIPNAELQRMSAAVQPVKDKFAASYDPVMVKLFFTEIDKLQSK